MSNEKKPAKKTVFISHKMKDKISATKIVKELRIYAPEEKLEFFLSADIEKGEEWHKKIHDKLRSSNLLILLYTDPTEKWDWSLYETGFFEGSARKGKRPLICLHSEGVDIPKPLKSWESVKAVKDDVITLLRQIYVDANPRLVEDREKLEALAMIIIEAVGPRPTQTYCNNYLLLSLDARQVETLKGTGRVPEEALVKSNDDSLRMFGLREKIYGEWMWGEIEKKLEGVDETGWISNLGITISSVAEDEDYTPCLPLFHSSRIGKTYRPVINRLDCLPDRSRAFKVIFVEIPSGDDPRPTGPLGTISTLMTFARKFRWGVIEKYRGQITKLIADKARKDEIDKCLENLNMTVTKLETEAARLGFFVIEDVIAAFSEPEDKEGIRKMAEHYGEFKRALMQQEEPEKLQEKLKDILDNLTKLREINKTFMVLGAKRYHELLKEME